MVNNGVCSINPETSSTQLDWDRYVGFEYGSYEIFRSDTTYTFSSIDLMASSSSTWMETETLEGQHYYRVGAVKEDPCYAANAKKAGAGPYHHALSNLDKKKQGTTLLGNIKSDREIQVYPNPVTEKARIFFPNPNKESFELRIYNIHGSLVRQIPNIRENEVDIIKGDLESGLYLLQITGPKIFISRFLIQ